MLQTVQWSSKAIDYESGFLLSARFSKCGNYIFCGGAGHNDLKVLTTDNFDSQIELKNLPSPVYSIASSPGKN